MHEGVDLLAAPGTPVISPVDGRVAFIGTPYKKGHPLHKKLATVSIQMRDGSIIRMLYVTTKDEDGKPLVEVDDEVKAGQLIGTVEDRAQYDTGMKNHVHVDVLNASRKPINPWSWLEQWGVQP